ncbi:hypothetical protein IMG5_113680, partial [Ichthyophthirius multifiliis]
PCNEITVKFQNILQINYEFCVMSVKKTINYKNQKLVYYINMGKIVHFKISQIRNRNFGIKKLKMRKKLIQKISVLDKLINFLIFSKIILIVNYLKYKIQEELDKTYNIDFFL